MSMNSLQNEALCRRDVLCTHAAASSVAPIAHVNGLGTDLSLSPTLFPFLASHAPIPSRRRSFTLQ